MNRADPTQPFPTSTRISALVADGHASSAVRRRWKNGDPERCQLCNLCTAQEAECLIVVPEIVRVEDAPLLRTNVVQRGWEIQDSDGPKPPPLAGTYRVLTREAKGDAPSPADGDSLDWFRSVMGV